MTLKQCLLKPRIIKEDYLDVFSENVDKILRNFANSFRQTKIYMTFNEKIQQKSKIFVTYTVINLIRL